jgi:hypothetical protein
MIERYYFNKRNKQERRNKKIVKINGVESRFVTLLMYRLRCKLKNITDKNNTSNGKKI